MISRGSYVWKNSRWFLVVFAVLLSFHVYNPYDEIVAILAYLTGIYVFMVLVLWFKYGKRF